MFKCWSNSKFTIVSIYLFIHGHLLGPLPRPERIVLPCPEIMSADSPVIVTSPVLRFVLYYFTFLFLFVLTFFLGGRGLSSANREGGRLLS